MEQLDALPDYIVAPEFRPSPCSLTLVAEWDAERRSLDRPPGYPARGGARRALRDSVAEMTKLQTGATF